MWAIEVTKVAMGEGEKASVGRLGPRSLRQGRIGEGLSHCVKGPQAPAPVIIGKDTVPADLTAQELV